MWVTKNWTSYFNALSAWTLEQTGLETDAVILEIGYGGGATLKRLVSDERSFDIYGLDYSVSAFQTSSRLNRIAIETGQLKLSVASVDNIPYENGKFTTIFAIQTHIFWPDLRRGLTEIYRVLSDKSQLIISCEKERITYHLKEYENSDLFAQILEEVGFNAVRIKETGNWICYQAFKGGV